MSSLSHPKTFKAAQITEKGGKFKIVNVAWKDPQRGQVVVKVQASGVCHSDSATVNQDIPGGLPRTPGHEIVGVIVQVGPGEQRFKVNDYVGSGWHGGHCHCCERCRKGDFITCENQNINGVFSDGGHAEYAVLRSEALAKLPEGLDPVQAAPFLCAGITVFNSLRHMDIMPGDVVAIQGVGGLGHLSIAFARASGYKVIALGRDSEKKELALQLGAHVYVEDPKDHAAVLQQHGGAKVALALAPDGKAMASLVDGLSVDGQLLVLALGDALTIPMTPIILKRISVRGWPCGTAQDSEETIAFAQAQGIKCMTETFKLEQIQEAYDRMMAGKARFRCVIKMD
ncbi:alcohol dehydrogenase [Sporobolomyces salmoneus]|uniref:alcohol dehydrogenase n=1 Tax=Sporobolomyces salmoneus TaxID=183962 RepID=UPI00316FAA9D